MLPGSVSWFLFFTCVKLQYLNTTIFILKPSYDLWKLSPSLYIPGIEGHVHEQKEWKEEHRERKRWEEENLVLRYSYGEANFPEASQ